MARKKNKKKKSSILGALVLEGIALVLFVFLVTQARAERQADVSPRHQTIPVLEGMFEQTPFSNFMTQMK